MFENTRPHSFYQGDLDSIIKRRFKNSYMNDSKWDKLISRLTENINLFIKYKLIHDNNVYNTVIRVEDEKPFFEEPVLYKEIEWIEWPAEYE